MKKKSGVFNSMSNKLAYTLMVILSIALLGIGVYAYGTSNPSNMGHTLGEIDHSGGIALYRCPASPISTSYCANVQLLRNGVEFCMGQLTTNPGSDCYIVDNNCAFQSVWGTCDELVGYLLPP
jgi:hypothetical protein